MEDLEEALGSWLWISTAQAFAVPLGVIYEQKNLPLYLSSTLPICFPIKIKLNLNMILVPDIEHK